MLHVSIITNSVNLRDFIKLYIIFSVLSEAFFLFRVSISSFFSADWFRKSFSVLFFHWFLSYSALCFISSIGSCSLISPFTSRTGIQNRSESAQGNVKSFQTSCLIIFNYNIQNIESYIYSSHCMTKERLYNIEGLKGCKDLVKKSK